VSCIAAAVTQVGEEMPRLHERRDVDLVDPEALRAEAVEAQKECDHDDRTRAGDEPLATPPAVAAGQ
jgi:hypothetical protein